MKKSSNIKKIFILFFLVCSVFGNIDLVSAEYDPGDKYTISKAGGYSLTNISANSSVYTKPVYNTTTTKTYVSGEKNCSGTYDSSDCKTRWVQYYATCSLPYSYCTPVSSYISSSYTYTSKTEYLNIKSIAEGKCKNTWSIKVKCCSSCPEISLARTKLTDYGRQDCPTSTYNSNSVTVDGVKYASGSYPTCVEWPAWKVCACSTTTSTQVGTKEKALSTSVGKVTETGAEAFCVAPGLAWPTTSTVYTPTPLNTAKCTENSDTFACGAVAIYEASRKNGNTYGATITGLRLWAAFKGEIGKDGMTTEGIESGDDIFYMSNPIYKTTADYIASSGYAGSQGRSSVPANVIYAMNSSGLDDLKKGIALFNIARNAQFKLWTPEFNFTDPVKPDEDGTFTFTITNKFDTTNTQEVSIQSTTDGITLQFENVNACKSGSCVVKGKINNYGEDNCPTSVSFLIKYKDKRDISKNVHLLSPDNPQKYQRFIVFDEQEVEGKYEDTVKLEQNCESFECTTPTYIQYDVPEECGEGTTGTVKDPEMDCIINSTDLSDKYDYTPNYITTTNSSVGNSSYKSSSFYKYIKNGFCQMQCRETVTYNFFGTATSDSTRFYTYGSTLETIIGDRECAVEIDYEKWKKAYEQANDAVRTTWNTYKYWENVHVYTEPRPETDTCSYEGGCSDSCSCGCTCDATDEYGHCTSWDCCYYSSCASSCSHTTTFLYWDPKDYTETARNGNPYNAVSSESHGYLYCGGSICGGWSNCTGYDGNPNVWYGAYSSSKNAYLNAVKNREALIADIQNCNLYSSYDLVPYTTEDYGTSIYTRSNTRSAYYEATVGYDFKPEITYNYEDEYNSLISIGTSVTLTKKTPATYCVGCKEVDQTSSANTKETLGYWVCTGAETGALCTDKKIDVPMNTLAYIQAQKTVRYSQTETFATTIPDGDIVPDSSDGSVLSLNKYNYIFPLEIGKLSGSYDVDSTYDTVGDADRKQSVKIEGGDYDCEFNVINKITIPSGFYYRQVDVTNVFPNAATRGLTGTWSTQRAKQLVAQVQNDGELVYKKTPEYEFLINPSNINKIKNYNSMLESDGTGYNDFNLSCTCETEICYCKSNFLTDISTGGQYSNFVKKFYRNGARQ